MIARPAVSVPWMQPTTSTRCAAAGSPRTTGRIARPSTLCPIGSAARRRARSRTYTQYVRRSRRGPYTQGHENRPVGAPRSPALRPWRAAAGAASGGSSATSSTPFVVLVTDINQLNDHGFNQLAYQGLQRAEKQLGVRGDVYQSASAQDYIPNLSTAARKNADLVVAVGFDQAAAVAKVAKEFPKTHFAIIDVDQRDLAGKPKNVEGLIFREQEVGYLAGYLAGLQELKGGEPQHDRLRRRREAAAGRPLHRGLRGRRAQGRSDREAPERVLAGLGRPGQVQDRRAEPDRRGREHRLPGRGRLRARRARRREGAQRLGDRRRRRSVIPRPAGADERREARRHLGLLDDPAGAREQVRRRDERRLQPRRTTASASARSARKVPKADVAKVQQIAKQIAAGKITDIPTQVIAALRPDGIGRPQIERPAVPAAAPGGTRPARSDRSARSAYSAVACAAVGSAPKSSAARAVVCSA